MEKKTFLFYTSWKKNVDLMNDEELRRFIINLINYSEGNEINLPTRFEQGIWNDVVELLDFNESKRQRTIVRRREAGQKGGAPVGNNNALKSTENEEKTTKNKQNKQMVELTSKTSKTSKNKQKQAKQAKQADIGDMLKEEGNRIYVEGDMLKEEGNRIYVEGDMLKEEGNRIYVEGDMLKEEGNIVKDNNQKKIDNLVLRINELMPENIIVNYQLSDTRDYLNIIFEEYPEWEQDLQKMGVNNFIFFAERSKKQIIDDLTGVFIQLHFIL